MCLLSSVFLPKSVAETNKDLCGKYAILNLIEEFHIGQQINKVVNIDLNDYKDLISGISIDSASVKLNLEKYDSVSEIEATEPDKLIPFTENFNLIKVAAESAQVFSKKCADKSASILALEPFMVDELTRLMEANSVDRTPVLLLLVGNNILSTTGKHFRFVSDGDLNEFINKYTKLTGMLLKNGTVYYETESEPETGFCYKANNPWDTKGPSRNKFLTTASKMISILPQIPTWYERIRQFTTTARMLTGSKVAGSEKYQLTFPPQLEKIRKFVSKFKKLANWESTVPSSIGDFQDFITNVRDMLPSATEKKTDELGKPEIEIKNVDSARLLAHLGIPRHFAISGKVILKLTSGYKKLDDSIPVEISATVYNKLQKALIYQVKPLIFERKMVDIKYVITWMGKSLSFSSIPLTLNCQGESPDPLNEPVKVCTGFSQAGSSLMNINDRSKCASALLSKVSANDIKSCPVTMIAAEEVTATRALCEGFKGEVAVISAQKAIKISVRCTEVDERTLTYKMFPVKIQTECELRLVEGKTDKLLLPQINSELNFNGNIQNGNLLIVTPSSTLTEDELRDIELERNATLTSALDSTSNHFNDLFTTYLPYMAFGISGFTMIIVTTSCALFFIGKKRTIAFLKKICCCIDYAKCFKKSCTCRRKRKRKEKEAKNKYIIDIENIQLEELSELLKEKLAKNNEATAPSERETNSHRMNISNVNSALSSGQNSPSNMSIKSASALQRGKQIKHSYR